MSKLHFIHGTMGSSKSLRLLALAHSFDEKGIPILVIKPSADTRDGKDIVKSRAGLERECISVDANINIYDVVYELETLMEKADSDKKLKWILVDECQFLTEEQINQLSDIVDYLKINVICYGLRTDFQSKLFPASKRLFEIADEVEEVKASCDCGRRASINARFNSNGEIVTNGSQILVGGDDLYHAICRKCWKALIGKAKK